MAYLDDLYSPEQLPAQQQLPESDFIGRGSAITEHIARTPGLARSMRYSASNRWNQDAQNYLGPLAAQDFAADARRLGDVGGMVASAGAPAYVALKAVSPDAASRIFGTGDAATSAASLDQVLRAYRGLMTAPRPEFAPPAPGAQPADSAIDPAATGRVQFGRDTPWYRGGHFTPNDVLPAVAAALAPIAGLARAGARGLAWEGAKTVGNTAATDAGERMFDAARGFIGGPNDGMPGWLKAALGVAGAGGAIEFGKWFAKEAPRRQ